jgi:hypothetical protein
MPCSGVSPGRPSGPIGIVLGGQPVVGDSDLVRWLLGRAQPRKNVVVANVSTTSFLCLDIPPPDGRDCFVVLFLVLAA